MKSLYWTVIPLLFFTISCQVANHSDMVAPKNSNISKTEAVLIVSREVLGLGYEVDDMDIFSEKFSTPWNKFFPKGNKTSYIIEGQKKLKGHTYWLVYMRRKSMDGRKHKGGDVGFFIDALTGEILAQFRGK